MYWLTAFSVANLLDSWWGPGWPLPALADSLGCEKNEDYDLIVIG